MTYYANEFQESKYHQVKHHPVRFEFLRTEMSIKNQNLLLEYLKQKLNMEVRVKREKGISIFLSSEKNNKKAIKYCFDNYVEIENKFILRSISIDLSKLQGGI